jgi:hypothetical protein
MPAWWLWPLKVLNPSTGFLQTSAIGRPWLDARHGSGRYDRYRWHNRACRTAAAESRPWENYLSPDRAPNRELRFLSVVMDGAMTSPRWDAPRPTDGGEEIMARTLLLILAVGSLAASTGCSSCFGNNNCRRPSFMEFQGGGCLNRRQHPQPQMAPCGAPACNPCGAPACDPCGAPAPCCEGGGGMISSPMSAPVVSEQGTFS